MLRCSILFLTPELTSIQYRNLLFQKIYWNSPVKLSGLYNYKFFYLCYDYCFVESSFPFVHILAFSIFLKMFPFHQEFPSYLRVVVYNTQAIFLSFSVTPEVYLINVLKNLIFILLIFVNYMYSVLLISSLPSFPLLHFSSC